MNEKRFESALDACAENQKESADMKADAAERKRPRGRPVSINPASVVLPPIRVTPDQAIRYRTAAKRAGRSLSAWIKWLADDNA
jgi:hypothetical protein